jgi:ketosteroid isomerase-like protein
MVAVLGLVSLASAARAADPVSAADQAAIDRVITSQIEAFRRDDAPGAFQYASPGIQQQFGDAGTFLSAVREAYRPVYRPQSFSFGALETGDGKVTQPVDLIGPDGRGARAIYDMEREADGNWRISGCHLLTTAEIAT